MFVSAILGAVLFFQFKDAKEIKTLAEMVEDKSDMPQSYDEWAEKELFTGEDQLESIVPYKKKMAFVHIGEMNSIALIGTPAGELFEKLVTFNDETESIYFKRQDIIPSQESDLLVLHDAYALDILLNQSIYSAVGETAAPISAVSQEEGNKEQYVVLNEGRLFLDQVIQIKQLNGSGEVEVIFQEQQKVLKKGEQATFEMKKTIDGVEFKSKIVVHNYGTWETDNMTFVVTQ